CAAVMFEDCKARDFKFGCIQLFRKLLPSFSVDALLQIAKCKREMGMERLVLVISVKYVQLKLTELHQFVLYRYQVRAGSNVNKNYTRRKGSKIPKLHCERGNASLE